MMKLKYPTSLASVFHNTCLVLALTAGMSLDFFSSAHGDVNAEHNARLINYPSCSRTKTAEDLIGHYSRKQMDGNLSQYHAYLSCVWYYGVDALPKDYANMMKYRYYNSECADIYQCVPVEKPDKGHILFFKGGGLLDERQDMVCGLNLTDLLIHRRNQGKEVDYYGKRNLVDELCSGFYTTGNPIRMVCPGITRALALQYDTYNLNFSEPPNPCDAEGLEFYKRYLYL